MLNSPSNAHNPAVFASLALTEIPLYCCVINVAMEITCGFMTTASVAAGTKVLFYGGFISIVKALRIFK